MKTLICLISLISFGNLHAQFNTAKLPSKPIDNSLEIIKTMTDPAVVNIEFKTIKRSSGNLLRITGTVKNKGGKNYISGANQQQVQLWENYSSTNRKMVKQLPFNQLLCNQELNIVFERPAFKVSDEFPPDYEVVIVYDPDILMDANQNNDDAVITNNHMTKNPKSR